MNRSDLYSYASVGNYGLGHSLLAWARCHIWSVRNDVEMVAPSWLHIRGRIGPILRRERDSRQYHRLFEFPDYVTGLRRRWILTTASRIVAEDANLDTLLNSNGTGLVVFSNRMSQNEETHFGEIVGYGSTVRAALTRMTREEYRPRAATSKHIALHVRMGDFTASQSVEALRAGAKNSRLPIDWYVRMLVALRVVLGPVPAIVYSDGSDDVLQPLLSISGVERAPRQQSVTDLLSICQSDLVLSSGSGFSMWGAYLGDIPRICFPGQRFVRVLGQPGYIDREPEAESAGDLDAAFLAYMQDQFAA
jgi:hypothetical protein